LLEVHSRIARLAAELAGRESPDSTSIEGIAAAPEAASDVLALDAALLKDNIKATRREKEHVNDLLDLTEFLLGVLGDQAEFQEKERELQHTELVNARDLADRGVIPLPRLRELEREEARLARDILEVKAFTARARQEKENLAFELDAADRKRSVDLQEKVRDAVLERTNLELEADLLSSQILAAGMAAAGPEGLSSPEARFLLHRVVEDGEQSIDADMSMEVLPGDVLEVTFEEGSLG
jgi:polysaccharide export outer membrane protein